MGESQIGIPAMSLVASEREEQCAVRPSFNRSTLRNPSSRDRGSSNTRIGYMYRDGGNYKFWGSCVLRGVVAAEDITPYLIDGEYFIPQHVGLRSLTPEVRNEDDHMLHEFLSFESTSDAANAATPANIFIDRMKRNKLSNPLWM